MKYLILLLACMSLACGEEEKDYVDIPAIITYIDAGVDADLGSDAVDSQPIDLYMKENCNDLRIDIAYEVEKCTDDLLEFWDYMTYIDSLECDVIRSGDYKKFCEEE